jgi:hypothetical protein
MQPKDIIDFKSSTNRYVKLFGKVIPLNYRGATSCTWHAEFGPISASVQFNDDSLFPWSAQIVVNNKATEHSSEFADILQVEKWVEDRLTAFRQTITALIPEPKGAAMSNITNVPRQHPPPPPNILGMDLCWEPDLLQWVLPGVDNLFDLRIRKNAEDDNFKGYLFAETKSASLYKVLHQLDALFTFIFELSANSCFPHRNPQGWRQLPTEPFELPCFAVRNKYGQHFVILKAANPQGDVRWYTNKETHPNVVARMTWYKITQDFDEYLELPS